ncbi:hypothetical protein B0H34DRAFT_767602 [Crassisporium funariophilum]|nr:hypothetical protein B0H34DRAFT_767602 [Crassisporium funariophilum]
MSVSPRKMVVDDTDSRIMYSSAWFLDSSGFKNAVGNFGPTLKSTLHGINSTGSLQFHFSGTSISLLGTNNIKTSGGETDPGWECFIDNVSIGSTNPFQFSENNWVLCSKQNLTDESHVLTVNVNSKGRNFWFDSIHFNPSDSVPSDNALLSIENNDPSIRYDSSWEALGETATMTRTKDAKVSYDFTGVSLAWYGLIPTELSGTPSLASYTIDGSVSVPFVLNGLSDGSVSMFNQLFFETPKLPFGPHTIVVTFESDQTSTPLSLDFLLVQNGTASSGPTFPSISTSSPTSTSMPLPFSSGSLKRVNVAGIVCGVLGAILFTLILIFLLLRYRKRKRENEQMRSATVAPFYPTSYVQDLDTSSTVSLHASPAFRQQSANYGRSSNLFPQPGPSGSPGRSDQSSSLNPSEFNESTSYYGGYQTWGQTKALEAASGAGRRDSYL